MNPSGGMGGRVWQKRAGGGQRLWGKASDKTIFIIICVAALAVAAVAIGSFWFGVPGPGAGPGWQCLKCDHKFSYAGPELPPIDCPKGHEAEAVRLGYRICPKCHKRVLRSRVRLPEPWASQYRRLKKQGNPLSAAVTAHWPREIQYRMRQDGGEWWSEWVVMRSPEAIQIESGLKCPKCGTSLYWRRVPESPEQR